jgi:hypothetical protein
LRLAPEVLAARRLRCCDIISIKMFRRALQPGLFPNYRHPV